MTVRNGINYLENDDMAASRGKSHRATPLPKCMCWNCSHDMESVCCQRTGMMAIVEKSAPAVRTFPTGATRDTDEHKLDFDGFLSPLALRAFGRYMHSHRKQSDGQLRDSDNWQKGIPREVFRKSAFRHFLEWWELHRAGEDTTEQVCALLFNLMGDLHESEKAKSRATGTTASGTRNCSE